MNRNEAPAARAGSLARFSGRGAGAEPKNSVRVFGCYGVKSFNGRRLVQRPSVCAFPHTVLFPGHLHSEEMVKDLAGRIVATVHFRAANIKVYLLGRRIDCTRWRLLVQ